MAKVKTKICERCGKPFTVELHKDSQTMHRDCREATRKEGQKAAYEKMKAEGKHWKRQPYSSKTRIYDSSDYGRL